MKLKFLFLQIFGTIIFFDLSSCKGYTIKQFKFLCSDFDETKLRVKRCELVAKRGRLGLVNFVVDYEGLPEIYLTMKLFYRGTSGKYQPYLIDVEIDACDVAKYASENKMLQRILQVFDEFDPNLRKGCPLHGPLNISDWEFDKEAEKFWPPVSPGV